MKEEFTNSPVMSSSPLGDRRGGILHTIMFKNYFKTAWRYMTRNKVSSVINVLGLSLGITFCLIIFLVIRHELSFDTFHPDGKQIYRMLVQFDHHGKTSESAGMLNPMADPLREEITGLEATTIFYNYYAKVRIPDEEKQFEAPRYGIDVPEIIVTDPWYFDIFRYDWVAGNPSSLREPNTVVLTSGKALKYFGDIPYDRMIGKEIIYGNNLHVVVSGIVKTWKRNSDFIFTDFISAASIAGSELKDQINMGAWGMWNSSTQVFVKLMPGVDPVAVESQFPAWVEKHVMRGGDTKIGMSLQPLSDIHFNTRLDDDYSQPAHLPMLYGLMAIAVFILVIGACNFINLSTAQSMQRAKEIGVRKVLGGRRSNLAAQFLGETLLVVIFATILSLACTYPLLRLFHSFVPQGAYLGLIQPFTWVFLLGVIVCTTLLAGFYPAKILSGGSPVVIMKGYTTHHGNSRNLLRKSLIVFQFTISLVLIICTLTVGNQIYYLMNKDLGFDRSVVINIKAQGNKEFLANQLKQYPYVEMVSLHLEPPTAKGHPGTVFKGIVNGEEHEVSGSMEPCDENYIPLYGLRLIAGHNLQPSTYMKEFVVNETFARQLGFNDPRDAVGQYIKSGMWDFMPEGESIPFDQRQAQIVGVVADFHQTSLHDPIKPMLLSATNQVANTLSVKLATTGKSVGEVSNILSDIKKTWKEVNPGERLEYAFYDDTIASFYVKEQKTRQVISAAMFMAIFISCMGLFGLAVFTTKQRTKEIGIRKILGASLGSILMILSGGFLKLVGLAAIIASPVAWYAMTRWLEGFAYHTPLQWWIFVLSGCIAVLIALATIGMQTLKIARANPVKAIKAE